MDRFNRDVSRRRGALAKQSEQSMGHVFSAAAAKQLPANAHSALTYYGVADAVALHFQSWTLRSVRTIVLLVLAAAVCYQTYSASQPKPLWMLVGYLATILFAYIVYGWARGWQDCQNKYLDYRALAEGLRVRLFWRLAGIKTQVADRYLSKQHSEMDWIRHAIRVWTIPAHADAAGAEFAPVDPARLQLVLDRWVKDQEKFFHKAANRDERRALLCVALSSTFLFLAAFGLAIVKAFLPSEDPLIVALSLILVASLLLQVYSRVLDYSEQAQQYRRMQKIFARGVSKCGSNERRIHEPSTRMAEGHLQDREITRDDGTGSRQILHREYGLVSTCDQALSDLGQSPRVADSLPKLPGQ